MKKYGKKTKQSGYKLFQAWLADDEFEEVKEVIEKENLTHRDFIVNRLNK